MRLAGSALSFFLLCILAHATTFMERPFQDTIQDAPNIVRGVVAGSYTDWAGQKGEQRIFTFYDLQLSEVFKGDIGTKTVVVREMGGEKDGLGMQVAGAARFDRGDDVVVLLGEKNSDGTYPVRGMMMGRYDIAKDEEDREYLVGAGVDGGAATQGRQEHDTHHIHSDHGSGGASPRRRWTLSDLREFIREQKRTEEKTAAVSNNNAPPKDQPNPGGSDNQAAPQLQTSNNESSEAPRESGESEGLPGWFAIALGGLGAFGAWMFLRTRTNR